MKHKYTPRVLRYIDKMPLGLIVFFSMAGLVDAVHHNYTFQKSLSYFNLYFLFILFAQIPLYYMIFKEAILFKFFGVFFEMFFVYSFLIGMGHIDAVPYYRDLAEFLNKEVLSYWNQYGDPFIAKRMVKS